MLHVYHHASISFSWWMITYTAPGGDAYFSAALNSLVVRARPAVCQARSDARGFAARADVHLLPAGNPAGQGPQGTWRRCDAANGGADVRMRGQVRARYLWWGRYLTQFQMAQFLANLVQARDARVPANATGSHSGDRRPTAGATPPTPSSSPSSSSGT